MRLLRDTSGTFEQARDSLQRDLVTLQRAFDQMERNEAALRTDVAALQAQLADPQISVAASGAIGGLPRGLQVVVHDGSMLGFGTPASPLRLAPTSAVSLGDILVATLSVTDAQLRALNTTPLQMVAAPGAGRTLIALYWTATVSVTAGFSDNAVMNFRYPDTTASGLANSTLGLTTTGVRITVSAWNSGQFNSPANTENKALNLFATADRTGGTSNGAYVTLYYLNVTHL